jgi:NitT/TauT family transport system substrate-binding protein
VESPTSSPPSHSHRPSFWQRTSTRLFAIAIAWLVVIAGLHYWRNVERHSGRLVKMGHMPVIANLACPLLEAASEGDDIRFSAIKYGSFAEMAESIRNKSIDAAFIIAPLPLVLRTQDVPVKIVYIGNRHESTLVARKDLGIGKGHVALLAGKSVAVPIRFSGHHLRRLLAKNGLSIDSIQLVEMQPPDMAAALQNGSLDAYFVGEPFAARSIRAGVGNVVTYVEEIWPRFMCNLMIVREDLIRDEPEVVTRLVEGAIRSGYWVKNHKNEAAKLASRSWGHDPELILYAMNTPADRVQFTLGIPVKEEMREMFDAMVEAKLLEASQAKVVDEIVEDHFAKDARLTGLTDDVKSIILRK